MATRKILPVREVRQNMSRLLDEAAADGEPVIITRHGRPAGYLIGYEALNQLMERLEDLEDLYWMQQGMAEYEACGGIDLETALTDIEAGRE
jgi:prevent-host-death family protein